MDTEITQAIIELNQAEQNFNYAAPEFIDIAIIYLLAARKKVDMLFNSRKQTGPIMEDSETASPR
ncbi:hypothetical protein LGK97_02630 [Clostridium sp. CS001]|uniref:hypothetical protein n=1 Tax=Clostridium sp. CS001 TaxID=2880648 RepID=UPI001CF5BAE5|nr:hypothetical protein [Clostridium sp. CS001]MCB2288658.1 hypothetical protein [Clostridium sp. CS001]